MAAVTTTVTTSGQNTATLSGSSVPATIYWTSTYEVINATISWPIINGTVVTSTTDASTKPVASSDSVSNTLGYVSSQSTASTSSTSASAGSETTAPTGSSKASSAPVKSNDSSHVSTGALAGAAVGCALGGILLGLVAALFLLRRRRRVDSHQTAIPPESRGHSKPKVVVSPSSTASDTQLDQFLLDATPDRDIVAELQALGDLIEQHVESNYHAGPTTSIPELSQCLVQLGLSRDTEAIAATCVRPESRQIGLRHVISEIIFRSIDIHSRSPLSMLPAPLAAFLQSIPPGNALAVSLALSKWRRLSAFLLHPDPSNRAPLPVLESVVTPQATALAIALNRYLHYFVAPSQASRGTQTNHLQDVIVECTKLGYVLLSQPQDWQFVFENNKSGLVVCPGLDKVGGPDSLRRRVVEPYAA